MLHSNYSNNKAHCRWAGQIAHREQKSRFCSKNVIGQNRNLIFCNNLSHICFIIFWKNTLEYGMKSFWKYLSIYIFIFPIADNFFIMSILYFWISKIHLHYLNWDFIFWTIFTFIFPLCSSGDQRSYSRNRGAVCQCRRNILGHGDWSPSIFVRYLI